MKRHSAILLALTAIAVGIVLPPEMLLAQDYTLYQELPGGVTTVSGTGIGAFFDYFEKIWPWVLNIAAGMAVLNGVIGGSMIMMSGSDSGMESAGKDKLKFSIAGLILIAMAGVILRILNPTFYT